MIKFDHSERKPTGKPVGYKDIMVDMANIWVIEDNNRLLLKNNIEYAWAKFIQASKMMIRSMTILFTNPNLTFM